MKQVQSTPGLPVYAYKVAAIVATYVNVETGYAWVTDAEIGETLGKQKPAVKQESLRKEAARGVKALVLAGLLNLDTVFKKGASRGVGGKNRRIFLALPEMKGQNDGTARNEGTKGANEGTDVCPNILDSVPSDERKIVARGNTREAVPQPFSDDYAFIDAFDRTLAGLVPRGAAGDVAGIVADAFDTTTRSEPGFMPFMWDSVCRLHDGGKARDWFMSRGERMLRKAA
ncbi:hypothetical protein [Devosia sp. Root436]|uniref:hypothetical protein n=1 Tax=Devosia sp. Root436 TaxID=1736537 RepID=UPI0012E35EA0|nr:hypothetical protein [Devosia sp. Root436]